MKRIWSSLILCLVAAAPIGCSNSTAPEESTQSKTPAAASPTAKSPAAAGSAVATRGDLAEPELTLPPNGEIIVDMTPASEVVAVFLDYLKAGDDAQALALLTKAAQTELAAHDFQFDALGAAQCTYTLGRTYYFDETKTGGLVEAKLTGPAEDGTEVSNEVLFNLRIEEGNWRLYGVAVDIGENQPPLAIDFEDMQDSSSVAAQPPASVPGPSPTMSSEAAPAANAAMAMPPAASGNPASVATPPGYALPPSTPQTATAPANTLR